MINQQKNVTNEIFISFLMHIQTGNGLRRVAKTNQPYPPSTPGDPKAFPSQTEYIILHILSWVYTAVSFPLVVSRTLGGD